MGHFAKDCWSKKKRDFKGKHHALVAIEEEEPSKRTRGSSNDQERRKDYYIVCALSGSIANSRSRWLIDNGASRHMTRYKDVLSNLKKGSYTTQVELGNEASYAIKGTGSISFQLEGGVTLHLDESLYVPRLKKNLISVAVLERKGYNVTLMEGKFLL